MKDPSRTKLRLENNFFSSETAKEPSLSQITPNNDDLFIQQIKKAINHQLNR